MSEPLLIQRQRTVFQALTRLLAEKTTAATAAETGQKARREAAGKERTETVRRVTERWEAEKKAAEKEHQQTTQAVTRRFETEFAAAQKAYEETRDAVAIRFEDAKEKATRQYEDKRWTAGTVFEANENSAQTPLETVQGHVAVTLQKIQQLQDDADRTLIAWRQSGIVGTARKGSKANRHHEDPQRNLEACLADSEEILRDLMALVVPRLFTVQWLVGLWVSLWLVLGGALYFAYPDGYVAGKYHWLAVSSVASLLLEVAAAGLLYIRARMKVLARYRPFCIAQGDAEVTCQRWLHLANKQFQEQVATLEEAKKRRDAELRQADEKHRQLLLALQQRHDNDMRQTEEKYPPILAGLEQRRAQGIRQADDKYRCIVTDGQKRFEIETRHAEEKYQQQIAACDKDAVTVRQTLTRQSLNGLGQVRQTLMEIVRESGQLFPPWKHPAWTQWTAPKAPPPVIRFGEYLVNLRAAAGALFDDGRWPADMPPQIALPAFLTFPQRCSMLLKVADAGRVAAVGALQAMMFRFLTTLPPGKVRFTIIDPVGLGENFSAFMHLADYDEQLMTSRIWTETQHITQRLTDLAAHMENVIQKYLRNQYKSIEEYNAQAGEVAEPFRVLVVANFPANFSPEATRRLVSIATSGASCGVYTLISVDRKQPLPDGFNLADLEQHSVNLTWKDDRFLWKEPDFGPHPLKLDAPPEPDLLNRLLHTIGEQARAANRVEVPFEFIMPPMEQWWTRSSRDGIEVPLGRAGATKRQHLNLGHGTAQHVLIAGKTGSGKSTLLHVLITNLSLLYSPDEVDLYLVDFKKGVEFKTYVQHRLPHAKVVAIESEREFGLSVLQRLDAELKQRGERFRQLNVQNINDYREASGQPCPRILLIVDEFQEFFVEDDRTAQDAALLLDRLVRQGRAFGLHVLLGSQTLGGAYSLARSTIDQMAVRIALQCSEADAHLILSKDNSAARLLSRPGEAMYNDANGMVEGNDIFQIVWLNDDKREELLKGIHERARQRNLLPRVAQLVFEGNVAADASRNLSLRQLLAAPTWPAAPRACSAWLGDAVAIKDPTAAVFRRQSSSNLLLIGQQEEGALGVLATAFVSLAAQLTPSADAKGPAAGARFLVLDGTPADAPHAGAWAKLAGAVPHPVQTGGWRELPALLGEVAAEVERRQKATDYESPPIYLFLFGIQRFSKDLRRQEDDFGLSRRGADEPVPPPKLLETILREGPVVGVHALIWCDSLNNLQRAFDRQGLRDFEMRVLFQMSANDSSFLIDSPVASRLGVHRALFCSEDLGLTEKFRPYSLPPEKWLAGVQEQLRKKQAAGRAAAGV